MGKARSSALVGLVLGLSVLLTGCGDKPADPTGTSRVDEEAADAFFAESCQAFRPDSYMDAIFSGFDPQDISRALELAQKAAAADEEKYGAYAASFQTFAENMGALYAAGQDPDPDLTNLFDATQKAMAAPPLTRPACPSDTGGLPVPSES